MKKYIYGLLVLLLVIWSFSTSSYAVMTPDEEELDAWFEPYIQIM